MLHWNKLVQVLLICSVQIWEAFSLTKFISAWIYLGFRWILRISCGLGGAQNIVPRSSVDSPKSSSSAFSSTASQFVATFWTSFCVTSSEEEVVNGDGSGRSCSDRITNRWSSELTCDMCCLELNSAILVTWCSRAWNWQFYWQIFSFKIFVHRLVVVCSNWQLNNTY